MRLPTRSAGVFGKPVLDAVDDVLVDALEYRPEAHAVTPVVLRDESRRCDVRAVSRNRRERGGG